MKKKLLSIVLTVLMAAAFMPAMAFAADEPSDWNLLSKALTNGDVESVDGLFEISGDNLFHTVKLLKDVDAGDNDIVIGDMVFLDLNHFNISTTGKVINGGCITVHQENAAVIDYLLYNAPGAYSVSEELRLPSDENPDYIIPKSTFMTAEVGTDPACQRLGFASGQEPLVWNKDVPAGMQLSVIYHLSLGGDIIAPKTDGIKTTNVDANILSLNDDITIGSSNPEDGDAILSVKSLYDDLFGDDIGVFNANGKTITLNRTGRFVISSDIDFDESVLVSGVEGKDFSKKEAGGTVTYYFPKDNPFVDVSADKYFYNPVLWALDNYITEGTDKTHFSPDKGVTRAQVVTFLWRAAGCPEPKSNRVDFTDVAENGYYEDAVAWAVEQDITKGTSETSFSPDAVCTRGQIVTFLARFAGVKDAETESAFTDVKATDYFAAAVKWAKDNKVTEGTTAATFSPNAECTRGQVVTFLYRWMEK